MRLGSIVFDPTAVGLTEEEVGVAAPERSAVERLWQLRVQIAYEHARSDLRRRSFALAELLLDRVDDDGLVQITSRAVAARIGGEQKSASTLLSRFCEAGLMKRLDDVVANDADGGYTGMVRLYRMWGQARAVRSPLYLGCQGTHPAFPSITGELVPAVPASRRDVVREASASLRAQVLARDGGCLSCGSRCCLVADHILPWSAGGKTRLANLQTLCRVCNTAKGIQLISFLGNSPVAVADMAGVMALGATSHGVSGYRKGCRCQVCKASARGSRNRSKTKKTRAPKAKRVFADPLPGLPRHNASSYTYYKCRCQECCTDKARQAKEWRLAQIVK